jgi:hypothetical protein
VDKNMVAKVVARLILMIQILSLRVCDTLDADIEFKGLNPVTAQH